ncbi:MAG: hypothetical protein QOH90_1845 [Actinomycetota bacterium]|jgi:hypothetical protein|nr:hypothetical protein [Actinomycetota bacterium]
MLGAFLIPIGSSSLRGLTHVLTCQERAKTPFTVVLEEGQPPTILSAAPPIGIDDPVDDTICNGLTLDLGVSDAGEGRVAVIVPITNKGKFEWRGTVALKAGKVTIPVNIGSIKPGVTEEDRVKINLDPGTTQLDGSLLIGP